MRNVCTGEILQTMQRGDPKIDLPTYYRVIDLKTAELFRIACFLGARLANRSDAYVEAAGSFGRHLGIAYQIYDDLADLIGTEDKIGKTLGTDIATGKATLPLILMRDRLSKNDANRLRDALAGEENANIPYWLEQLDQLGIFEEVRQAVFNEIRCAREQIEAFLPREDAKLLHTISELLWNQVETLGSVQSTS
jgi:octaprenyl-diphosphate synthase